MPSTNPSPHTFLSRVRVDDVVQVTQQSKPHSPRVSLNVRTNLVVQVRRRHHLVIQDIHFLIGLQVRSCGSNSLENASYTELPECAVVEEGLVHLLAVVVHDEACLLHLRRQLQGRLAFLRVRIAAHHPRDELRRYAMRTSDECNRTAYP